MHPCHSYIKWKCVNRVDEYTYRTVYIVNDVANAFAMMYNFYSGFIMLALIELCDW
jgi:hypothetical protein